MKRTYDCPVCGDEVEVGWSDEKVTCKKCGTHLVVEPDADFDNGSWKDLTVLRVEARA